MRKRRYSSSFSWLGSKSAKRVHGIVGARVAVALCRRADLDGDIKSASAVEMPWARQAIPDTTPLLAGKSWPSSWRSIFHWYPL
eukprot:scaffold3013_cov113-Isochrysis_galbana.AAC.7